MLSHFWGPVLLGCASITKRFCLQPQPGLRCWSPFPWKGPVVVSILPYFPYKNGHNLDGVYRQKKKHSQVHHQVSVVALLVLVDVTVPLALLDVALEVT